MPLTDADVERIAQRAAEMVWQRPTLNAKGERPPAEAILAAAEGRAWDVQDRVYDLLGIIRTREAGVDLDALAAKVADVLAARLGRA